CCRSEAGVFEEADYFGLTYPGSRGEELWVKQPQSARQAGAPARPLASCGLAVQLFHLDGALRRAGHQHPNRSCSHDNPRTGGKRKPLYGCHFHPVKDCQRRKLINWELTVNRSSFLPRRWRSSAERAKLPKGLLPLRDGDAQFLSAAAACAPGWRCSGGGRRHPLREFRRGPMQLLRFSTFRCTAKEVPRRGHGAVSSVTCASAGGALKAAVAAAAHDRSRAAPPSCRARSKALMR
uniref:FERM domain-containing protein n=1 Tax=Macrostomum lignano TaxID=282301 RepID=A0A1I8FGG1_9PLAT